MQCNPFTVTVFSSIVDLSLTTVLAAHGNSLLHMKIWDLHIVVLMCTVYYNIMVTGTHKSIAMI